MSVRPSLAGLVVGLVLTSGCAPTHMGLGYGLRRNENLSLHARWETQKDQGIVHGFAVRVWTSDDTDEDGAAVTYGLRLGGRWHYHLGGGLTSRDLRLREHTMCADQGPGYQFGANAVGIAHISCIGDDQGLNWLYYERELEPLDFDERANIDSRHKVAESSERAAEDPAATDTGSSVALPSLLGWERPQAPWQHDWPQSSRRDTGQSSSAGQPPIE